MYSAHHGFYINAGHDIFFTVAHFILLFFRVKNGGQFTKIDKSSACVVKANWIQLVSRKYSKEKNLQGCLHRFSPTSEK